MQIDAGLACDAVHTAQKHALKEKSNRDNDSSSNEKKYVSESIESRVGKKSTETPHFAYSVCRCCRCVHMTNNLNL